MVTDLVTLTGEPLKGGTAAVRNVLAIQAPTSVPAKGAPAMEAWITRPADGPKMTFTLDVPVGPSAVRHAFAF